MEQNGDSKITVKSVDISLRSYICDMNGIIDLSDISYGSQIAALNPNALNHFKSILLSHCQAPIITLSEQVEQFDAILNTYYEEVISVRQYFFNSLQAIKNIYTGDELAIVEDIYTHILKVHLYHDYFFKSDYKPKSEADFLIKLWSPVLYPLYTTQTKHNKYYSLYTNNALQS